MKESRPCPPENRTMFPKTHQRRTPLTPSEVESARAEEKARKRWDPNYIDAKDARSIPPDVLERDAVLRGRIEYSQPDWPENRMSATDALGPLKPGCGEEIEERPTPTESLFTGGKVEDD